MRAPSRRSNGQRFRERSSDIVLSSSSMRGSKAGKLYRVGWIYPNASVSEMAGPNPVQGIARAFVHALRDLGYVEG